MQSLDNKVNNKWVSSSNSPQRPIQIIDYGIQNNLENIIIKDLQENIKYENQKNSQLRTKLENVARKHIYDKENAEGEKSQMVKKLNEMKQGVFNIQQFSFLMQENVNMKKQQVFLQKNNKEILQKNNLYSQQVKQLRDLVIYISQDLENKKRVDIRQTEFWKQIQVDQVVQDSEPPLSFPQPMDCNDKNLFILRQDLERLQYEQKKNLNEIKALTSRLGQCQLLLETEKKQKSQLKKESNNLITQLKQQLLGAIEEKKKVDDELEIKAKYTAKLEYKIVQENLNNKGLRQKIQILRDEGQEKIVKEQLQEFDQRYQIKQQPAYNTSFGGRQQYTVNNLKVNLTKIEQLQHHQMDIQFLQKTFIQLIITPIIAVNTLQTILKLLVLLLYNPELQANTNKEIQLAENLQQEQVAKTIIAIIINISNLNLHNYLYGQIQTKIYQAIVQVHSSNNNLYIPQDQLKINKMITISKMYRVQKICFLIWNNKFRLRTQKNINISNKNAYYQLQKNFEANEINDQLLGGFKFLQSRNTDEDDCDGIAKQKTNVPISEANSSSAYATESQQQNPMNATDYDYEQQQKIQFN